MAYRFKRGDVSLEVAVRRIAGEQVASALAAIAEHDAGEAVHEVRKTCKKVRALIRLVRPSFPAFRRENARVREIAADLSSSRDAAVMLETFDLLAGDADTDEDRTALVLLHQELAGSGDGCAASLVLPGALERAQMALTDARVAVAGWTIDADGWLPIGRGLVKILRKAEKAARSLEEQADAESYHRLRQRMKHHWYHTRLLEPIWPAMMAARAAELEALTEQLGLHHDICVLMARLEVLREDGVLDRPATVLARLAGTRRRAIEQAAAPVAMRLLVEEPAALAEHWGRLWTIWRDHRAGRQDF